MPQVPVYSSPTVAPNELPGIRQQTPYRLMQAAEVGPGQTVKAGQALIEAGAEGLREATQSQIQTNEAKAKEYDANLMGAIQGVLYGTPDDPNSGYVNQKGKNAIDAYHVTVQKLQQVAVDQGQSLENTAQQDLVKTPAQMRIQSAIAQVSQHMAQQSDVYQIAAGGTRIKVAQDGAAQAYNPVTDKASPNFDHDNPGANSQYQQYLATIASEANDLADRKGLSAATPQDKIVRDAFIQGEMQKAYIGTLGHLIDKKGGSVSDMAVATAYYDQIKDQLTAEQQDKIRPVLEAGDMKNKALALALDIKSKMGNIGGQESELDDLFKAGKITADVHQLALQHLRADNAQRRSEQIENDKSLIGTVWDMANQGKKMTDLTAGQLAYIKQRGLGAQIDSIFSRESAAQDDSKMYSDLARLSAEDPSAFSNMDLSTVSGSLSKAHWNHLIEIQRGINKQDVKAMESNKLINNTIKDTKANLVAAGFNLNPKPNTSEAKRLEAYETDLRDALTAAQEQKGSALTRDEAREIALGHLKDQALAGTGYFGTSIGQTHKPVYQMTPEERAKPWVIPDGDRAQIKASLLRQGLPASEDNIQRAYKLKQGVR